MSKPLLISAALCLVLAACNKPAVPAQVPAPAPPATSPAAPAVAATASPEQAALVAVIAADDCDKFRQAAAFKDWAVTVNDAYVSTVNGSIDITFVAGPHVILEQVVQTKDPVFAAVAALRPGEAATVSGRFAHGNGECSYRLDKVSVALTAAR